MSMLPFTTGTGTNVQNATLLAGINPQQLLFGGSGLTNNPTLNGLFSTFQAGSSTGFSPDAFNFTGNPVLGNNPLLPTGTGGTTTPNVLLNTGTGGTTTPNTLLNTGTGIPNPLTGTGGTSTANLLNVNPLNNTPLLGGQQNLSAIPVPGQNPALFSSNSVIPPSSTGLGGTTNLLSSGPVIGQLGLGGATGNSNNAGLTQVLTVLVQLLTQLGPAVLAAKPPAAATPDPTVEDPNKKITDRLDALEKENKKLKEDANKPPEKPNTNPANPPPPADKSEKDQVTDLKNNFDTIDTNNDGILTSQEIKSFANNKNFSSQLTDPSRLMFANIDAGNAAWWGLSRNDLDSIGGRLNGGENLNGIAQSLETKYKEERKITGSFDQYVADNRALFKLG